MVHQVIAIDPGETTGFVVAKYGPNQNITFLAKGIWQSMDDFLNPIIQQYIKDSQHVVIEDYRVYPHKAAYHVGLRPYAIEVIGQVRLVRHPLDVHFQSASQAKQRWPNNRLKQHQLYITNPIHARDALRHLLTFLEDKDDFGPMFSERNAI